MEQPNRRKRKMEHLHDDNPKRVKITDSESSNNASQSPSNAHVVEPSKSGGQAAVAVPELSNPKSAKVKGKEKAKPETQPQKNARQRIRKLVAPRPFPTVPTSVSATGPRSAHREGKNMICLTRKSTLPNYMRRCKDVIINDGYKTLHLSAMGAAIPLLLQLVTALPPILPFAKDEISYETTTATVEVTDEVIPEDEDEDISYQTRGKSALHIVFKIGDGEFEGDRNAIRRYSAGKSVGKTYPPRNNSDTTKKGQVKEVNSSIVFEEPEQEVMDML